MKLLHDLIDSSIKFNDREILFIRSWQAADEQMGRLDLWFDPNTREFYHTTVYDIESFIETWKEQLKETHAKLPVFDPGAVIIRVRE